LVGFGGLWGNGSAVPTTHNTRQTSDLYHQANDHH